MLVWHFKGQTDHLVSMTTLWLTVVIDPAVRRGRGHRERHLVLRVKPLWPGSFRVIWRESSTKSKSTSPWTNRQSSPDIRTVTGTDDPFLCVLSHDKIHDELNEGTNLRSSLHTWMFLLHFCFSPRLRGKYSSFYSTVFISVLHTKNILKYCHWWKYTVIQKCWKQVHTSTLTYLCASIIIYSVVMYHEKASFGYRTSTFCLYIHTAVVL